MKVAFQIIFETESLSTKSADLKFNSSLTPRVGAQVRCAQVDVPSFAFERQTRSKCTWVPLCYGSWSQESPGWKQEVRLSFSVRLYFFCIISFVDGLDFNSSDLAPGIQGEAEGKTDIDMKVEFLALVGWCLAVGQAFGGQGLVVLCNYCHFQHRFWITKMAIVEGCGCCYFALLAGCK